MSEWDNRSEPHVSPEELRAALVPRGERRNPVLVSERSEQASAEVAELRAALDAARGDAAELRAELASAKADLRERRSALERLASAGMFRRRRVVRDLRSRGLV